METLFLDEEDQEDRQCADHAPAEDDDFGGEGYVVQQEADGAVEGDGCDVF